MMYVKKKQQRPIKYVINTSYHKVLEGKDDARFNLVSQGLPQCHSFKDTRNNPKVFSTHSLVQFH